MKSVLSPAERRELVATAEQVALEAGHLAAEAWAKPRGAVDLKGVIDLVTETDRACEELIKRLLADRTGLPVLGEESGLDGGDGAVRFIVDPIDGTTNFAHRLPHFAVSIGVEDTSGPVAGVIYAPIPCELFVTDGETVTVNKRRAPMLEPREIGDSLLVSGFPYDRRTHADNNLDLFAAFTMRARCTRVNGSAALDLAYVATTRADAYWERSLKPWDACAGVAMVRAVGGEVTSYSGEAYTWASDTLVAGHPHLTAQIRAVIAQTRGTR